jgi:hypothetical protein
MSLTDLFSASTDIQPPERFASRPSPFSLRLTAGERARLVSDAGPLPLGTYIKSRLFAGTAPARRRGPSIADREALAKVLAQLGRSHLASNLNQLARAVNIGALPLTPETEAELLEAIRDVRAMRILLMQALGLKPEMPA